jgi:hypothetical protein
VNIFKTDASELKKSIDLQLVEDIHEHASKEVVCFKIIMQHSLVYARFICNFLHTCPKPFWNTVLAALNIFLQ